MCGCNFPPSQFQLHLQFFLMPWLPSHYKAFTAGVSLSHRRWFPLEYIKGLLGLNQPMAVELDTSLDEIFAVFDAQLSYDTAFEQEVARSGSSSMASSSLAVTHDPWYTYLRRRLRAPDRACGGLAQGLSQLAPRRLCGRGRRRRGRAGQHARGPDGQGAPRGRQEAPAQQRPGQDLLQVRPHGPSP